MLWGCFSGAGLGTLVPVRGNLNASAYRDILDNYSVMQISPVQHPEDPTLSHSRGHPGASAVSCHLKA